MNAARSTWILRVLYRRKRLAVRTFAAAALLGLVAAFALPLRYESQAMIERKPPRLSPQITTQQRVTDFELARLTSETQRVVALIQSRAMMEAWAERLGLVFDSPRDEERTLKKLSRSFSVQPINYTDLFVLKARGRAPEQARRRAAALAVAFSEWDAAQAAREAQSLIGLLEIHREKVRAEMAESRAELRALKSSQSASLLGSPAQQELQATIDAQQNLYNNLTAELEAAQRPVDGLNRTRLITPASAPLEPLTSRGQRVLLVLCLAFLLAFAAAFLAEWQDPAVYRAQQVARSIPFAPVLSVPRFESAGTAERATASYLGPLADSVTETVRAKGSALVQITGVRDGDGAAEISSSLVRLLSPHFRVSLQHALPEVPLQRALPGGGAESSELIRLPPETESLKDGHQVVVLDLDPVPNALPGTNLSQQADVVCVVLSAGRTPRQLLKPLRQQLDRFRNQKCVLVLNQYEDPLPARFQR